MKRIEVNFGSDWFDRIRMGYVTRLGISELSDAPEPGDTLIINRVINGVSFEKMEAIILYSIRNRPGEYIVHLSLSRQYAFRPNFVELDTNEAEPESEPLVVTVREERKREPEPDPPGVILERPVFSDYPGHAELIAEAERKYFSDKQQGGEET